MLGDWLAGATRSWTNKQHPADELHAEHMLQRPVLEALRREARRLAEGQPLRPAFWRDAVDVIGNYVHRVHRQKEERCMFPLMAELGWDENALFRSDHRRAEEVTLELCDAVESADWEAVVRLALLYATEMEKHMEHEEESVLAVAREIMLQDEAESVRSEFAQIEREVLGEGGRARSIEVVLRLCRLAGLDPRAYGLIERPEPALAT
jgi:hemerythrin-like domain-containing protein